MNGETRPVLGRVHPDEQDARVAVLQQWGIQAESPRAAPAEAVLEPLSQREQSILHHRLNPGVQRRLNGGAGQLAASRRDGSHGAEQHHVLDGDADH